MAYLKDREFLTSRIALIFLVLCLPYYLIFDNLGMYYARDFVFPTALPAALSYFLYRGRLHLASKMVLILGTALCLFIAADILGVQTGMETLALALLPFPFLLFNHSEKKWVFLCVCGIMLSYVAMGKGWASFLVQAESMSPERISWMRRSAEWTASLLLTLSSAVYFFSRHRDAKKLAVYMEALESSHQALRTSHQQLAEKQVLLKRRVLAMHDLIDQSTSLEEWRHMTRTLFRYQLNIPRVEIWVSEGLGRPLYEALPAYLISENPIAIDLVQALYLEDWVEKGVSLLLPLRAMAGPFRETQGKDITLMAVVGLVVTESLGQEDLDFVTLIAKELQKNLQFIKSAETLKMLNVADVVIKNTSFLRAKRITERELEIIKMMAQGYSNPNISEALMISESTTKTHVYNIFRKLEINNRFELLRCLNEQLLV